MQNLTTKFTDVDGVEEQHTAPESLCQAMIQSVLLRLSKSATLVTPELVAEGLDADDLMSVIDAVLAATRGVVVCESFPEMWMALQDLHLLHNREAKVRLITAFANFCAMSVTVPLSGAAARQLDDIQNPGPLGMWCCR